MATTTAPALRLSPLPPATGRAGLAGALRSEFTKLRSVRSTYWTLLAMIVVSVGIGAAITGGVDANWSHLAPPDKATFDATQVSLFAFFQLGQLVLAVLGALAITSEYSTGMIRTSLTAQPRRSTVYAAKAIVFTAVALVVSLVTSFIAFFLGQALLSSTGASATLSDPNLLPQSWRDDMVRFMPDAAGRVVSVTVAGNQFPHLWSAWPQFAVTAIYAAVLLGVGGYLFRKRDA